MTRRQSYIAATLLAEEKRRAFLNSLNATKARVQPGRLAQDAKGVIVRKIHGAVTGAIDTAKQRPWATGAASAALIAYLARRPIGSFLRRVYVRARTGQWETQDG